MSPKYLKQLNTTTKRNKEEGQSFFNSKTFDKIKLKKACQHSVSPPSSCITVVLYKFFHRIRLAKIRLTVSERI